MIKPERNIIAIKNHNNCRSKIVSLRLFSKTTLRDVKKFIIPFPATLKFVFIFTSVNKYNHHEATALRSKHQKKKATKQCWFPSFFFVPSWLNAFELTLKNNYHYEATALQRHEEDKDLNNVSVFPRAFMANYFAFMAC